MTTNLEYFRVTSWLLQVSLATGLSAPVILALLIAANRGFPVRRQS
ncbi:hypothetical protein [Amycolatopsis kentuckyensis]|nr:hypothetical protein [Amycolatopsis kentuckyensis]